MTSNLPTLPDGWEWKKVADIAFIKGGKRIPKGKKLLDQKTEYPYIRVTDFTDDGTIDLYNIQYINKDIYDEIKNYTITSNDLYISIAGTIGKTGIIPEILNGANLTENAVKLVYKTDQVDNKFVYLFTQSNSFMEQAGLATKTVAMPKLAISRLSEIQIPLPPLEKQKRLVALLDTLFAKIDRSLELLNENIVAADALLPSALNTVFGELGEKWRIVKTNDICTKITDGTHATPKYINFGIPFLSVKDITKGFIDFSNTRYISEEEHKFLSTRCNVEKNDLLYTKVGTTGVAKVVDTDNDFSIFVSIALLKPKHDVIQSKYFEYILNSPNCYEQAQNRTRGVANRNLVLKDIKEITFPLPPLDIQTQSVAYLDSIREKVEILKHAQNDKIKNLKALKASLLDRAFKGEL